MLFGQHCHCFKFNDGVQNAIIKVTDNNYKVKSDFNIINYVHPEANTPCLIVGGEEKEKNYFEIEIISKQNHAYDTIECSAVHKRFHDLFKLEFTEWDVFVDTCNIKYVEVDSSVADSSAQESQFTENGPYQPETLFVPQDNNKTVTDTAPSYFNERITIKPKQKAIQIPGKNSIKNKQIEGAEDSLTNIEHSQDLSDTNSVLEKAGMGPSAQAEPIQIPAPNGRISPTKPQAPTAKPEPPQEKPEWEQLGLSKWEYDEFKKSGLDNIDTWRVFRESVLSLEDFKDAERKGIPPSKYEEYKQRSWKTSKTKVKPSRAWIWWTGGTVVAAGVASAVYFISQIESKPRTIKARTTLDVE